MRLSSISLINSKLRLEMIKVLIWENSTGSGAMNHPGHAAVAITRGMEVESYISWWPKEATGFKGTAPGEPNTILLDHLWELSDRVRDGLARNRLEPWPGQTNEFGIVNHGMRIRNPLGDWVQQPQSVISIPSIDDGTQQRRAQIGLRESNMKDWWDLYKMRLTEDMYHKYGFVSKRFNCASIAMAALRAGGSPLFDQDFQGKRKDSWLYYTPLDVKEYAIKVKNRISQLNAQMNSVLRMMLGDHRQFIPEIRQTLAEHPLNLLAGDQGNNGDLWTCEQWTKESSVKFGRRKDQILAIDVFLQQYWARGVVWDENNSDQKANDIYNILYQVQNHIINKPTSDRREAVLKLGSQCIMVVRNKSAENRLIARIDQKI